MLEVNNAVGDWTAAWRIEEDQRIESTRVLDAGSKAGGSLHFAAGWYREDDAHRQADLARRAHALTSGVLDALLQSQRTGGKTDRRRPTFAFAYQPGLALETTSAATAGPAVERAVIASVSRGASWTSSLQKC